jgi:hypothetical protein
VDYTQNKAQISILPPAYKNPSPSYEFFMNSVAMGLTLYTEAIDALVNNASFTTSKYNWLNTWGNLFVVPRGTYENSSQYSLKIQNLISTGNGTPIRIQDYIYNIYGVYVTISENFISGTPNYGYTLKFNGSIYNMKQLALDLNRVRPAGVPIYFDIISGGNYINTINFIGAWRTTGSYLSFPITAFNPNLPESTNNAQNTLPTNYLTATAINPNL